ncbi:MAG TPA: hypothetical protein VF297_29010 [Pyrinomonadaceae bacterium]
MHDASKKPAVSLSVGELAFALALLHSEEAAADLVRQQFGASTEREVELVVVASGHSLLARGLLDEAGGEYELAPALAESVRRLAEAGRTILCNRVEGSETSHLAFHFAPGGPVKHSVRDERVHELEVLDGLEEVLGHAAIFYSAPARAGMNIAPARLPPAEVDETFFSQDPVFIRDRLLRAGVPFETSLALTDSIINRRFWGSVARVDHPDDREPTAEHRVSLLRGATELWLLRPRRLGDVWLIELSLCPRDKLKEVFSGILSE